MTKDEPCYREVVHHANQHPSLAYVARKTGLDYQETERLLELALHRGDLAQRDYAGRRLALHVEDHTKELHTRIAELQERNEKLRAALEALRPLPVSIQRMEELWASQRSFHGGEPLKMCHVEFARLLEVEYGVLGRIPIREENGGQIDPNLIACPAPDTEVPS